MQITKCIGSTVFFSKSTRIFFAVIEVIVRSRDGHDFNKLEHTHCLDFLCNKQMEKLHYYTEFTAQLRNFLQKNCKKENRIVLRFLHH